MSLVGLGYADDEAQVRLDQAFDSGLVAGLYACGDLGLLLRTDPFAAADVRKVMVDGELRIIRGEKVYDATGRQL